MPFLSEFRKMFSNVCESSSLSSFLMFFRKISANYVDLVWKCISSEYDIKMFLFFHLHMHTHNINIFFIPSTCKCPDCICTLGFQSMILIYI